MKNIANVLKILVEYTNKPRNILPEECVIAVENLLNFEDFKNDSITILNNVIQNGQIVNNKTLKLITEKLYFPLSCRERLNAFKLLEKARLNQDVSAEVFTRIELAKAGYGLEVLKNRQRKTARRRY